MIYLDSSALLKLLVEEAESAALQAWLEERPGPRVSSDLCRVEVARAARRLDPEAASGLLGAAVRLCAGLDLVPLEPGLVEAAGTAGPAGLRTLDALHLVSALSLQPHLTAVVVYDRRLAEAVEDAGLPLSQPS